MKLQLALLAVVAALATAPAAELPVVSGTTVVHDLVVRIGGERVQAHCLVKAGVDPHTYRPTSDDARRLADARLIVVNGLGFEGWFTGLLKESNSRATVIEASKGVEPIVITGHDCAGQNHDHDHGGVDPHAWHDVANVRIYARTIRDGLTAADPAGAATFQARAAAVDTLLADLDRWVRKEISAIPAARRVLVTNHDALGYFCRAYGFEVKAPLTSFEDAEPDAKKLAALIDFIRAEKVRAVFLESAKNAKLVERIASEAGVAVGGTLYLDGMPDPATGLTSYEAVVRHNITAIVNGLK
ncbi:MAG: zinc ABC transporter substrate-binding protein [Planctomycetes bacterium]|nr:zinc ABC transporter substrate-binding protein [Planctomycetota bacterium]